jgi:hypothetical protein
MPTAEGENIESDISPSPPPVVQQVVQPAPVEQPIGVRTRLQKGIQNPKQYTDGTV